MFGRIHNTRWAETGPASRFPKSSDAFHLATLALLLTAGTPLVLGQNGGLGPVYGFPGYSFGSVAVNSSTTKQVTVAFKTFSNLGSYSPNVSLRFGVNYSSAATANCTQSANPNQTLDYYPYLETCTVAVTFTPLYPGGHRDAVFILGSDGKTQIGGEFLYGIGTAPQLMIQPGVTTSLTLPGSPYLYGSATDDTGTYYVYANNSIYTVKGGVASQYLNSFPTSYELSMDGAGNLFSSYQGGYTGYEYETAGSVAYNADLTYTTPQDPTQNPQEVPFTTVFSASNAVAAGNTGTFYEADGGGEYANASYSVRYSPGLLVQAYGTQYPVTSPGPTPGPNNVVPAYGDLPEVYPYNGGNYSPNSMIVDPYENLFFADSNGITEWKGNSMVLLNQLSPGGSMAVDAADTIYADQFGVNMFSASNNYASAITSIGVSGGASGNSIAPDGTLYVESTSTLDIIDRSQGAINYGSNNGQVSNPQTVTLYNGGNQPLTVSSIAITGDGYTMQPASTNGCSNGIVIASGTICQLQVSSSPPHAGVLAGAVTVTSNSLNTTSTTQTVSLTGYTSGVYVSAAPSPLDFGYVAPGQNSTLPLTLTNTSAGSTSQGYGSTSIIQGSVTSNNSAFTVTIGNCSNPVLTGMTCTMQVTFNPSAAQAYTGATLTWVETIYGGACCGPAPTQTVTVNLTGTGINPIIPESDTETIQISDNVSITPSTLLPINEVIYVSDNTPSTIASTLLPINETLHISDAETFNTIAPFVTTTTLTPSANVVHAGGAVTLTAAVSAFGTTQVASGTVSFYQDGSGIGSAALNGGVATLSSASMATGTHAFYAVYAATNTFNGSISATATVNATNLDVLAVTAQSVTRAFATNNPAFTYNVTGFTNGETSAVLSGAPVFATTATLNSPAGTYPLTISAGTLTAPSHYAFNFVAGTVTVSGGAIQTITFAPIPNLPIAIGQITLTAHSSSGLPITYTVSGPAILNGYTLMLQGQGTVTVTASQSGNGTFARATSVVQTFMVTP